jgi:hypothetical protein
MGHACNECGERWLCERCISGEHRSTPADTLCPPCNEGRPHPWGVIPGSLMVVEGNRCWWSINPKEVFIWRYADELRAFVYEERKKAGLL